MDNATRCAKQEITEAGKFLRWLLDEHGTTINDLQQAHLDTYLSDGPTTRNTIRNFIQWRTRAGIAGPFKTRYRTARNTPLTSSLQRRWAALRVRICGLIARARLALAWPFDNLAGDPLVDLVVCQPVSPIISNYVK